MFSTTVQLALSLDDTEKFLLIDIIRLSLYFNSCTPYLDIFSNFHVEPLKINGQIWKTGEHFYQVGKFAPDGLQEDENVYKMISNAETPGIAKRLADENFSEANKLRSHRLREFPSPRTNFPCREQSAFYCS